MKSVLHLRIDSPGYSSDAIMNGFIENGYEYHSLCWQNERFNNGVEYLRNKVIEMAAAIRPTILFCHLQNGEVFDMPTWIELSKLSFVINFSFDVRDRKKSEWLYQVAPIIGHSFFSNQEDVEACNILGFKNTSVMQSSCDMELYKPNNIHSKYAFDVVFVGGRYDNTNLEFPLSGERQRMIQFLKNHYGNRFMAYGNQQDGGAIQPGVEANVYNASKISICQNNFERTLYCSDRVWKIMASGSFCLLKWFPGIDKLFEKEVHCDWFKDFQEMGTLIDYYLSDEEERKAVAKMGCQFVMENHRWQDRIRQMDATINAERLILTN